MIPVSWYWKISILEISIFSIQCPSWRLDALLGECFPSWSAPRWQIDGLAKVYHWPLRAIFFEDQEHSGQEPLWVRWVCNWNCFLLYKLWISVFINCVFFWERIREAGRCTWIGYVQNSILHPCMASKTHGSASSCLVPGIDSCWIAVYWWAVGHKVYLYPPQSWNWEYCEHDRCLLNNLRHVMHLYKC